MKTRQKAIKVFYNMYGCQGYTDLVQSLSKGWLVKRADYLYNANGTIVSNVYILEKEEDEQND